MDNKVLITEFSLRNKLSENLSNFSIHLNLTFLSKIQTGISTVWNPLLKSNLYFRALPTVQISSKPVWHKTWQYKNFLPWPDKYSNFQLQMDLLNCNTKTLLKTFKITTKYTLTKTVNPGKGSDSFHTLSLFIADVQTRVRLLRPRLKVITGYVYASDGKFFTEGRNAKTNVNLKSRHPWKMTSITFSVTKNFKYDRPITFQHQFHTSSI